VTTETMTTTVVKNKSTERNRDFWSHVETVADQSRRSRAGTICESSVRNTDAVRHDGASESKPKESLNRPNGDE
jgi:hypothetical protein